MQESATTVRDLVARLAEVEDVDRFEVAPAIYARRPWTPDSEALVLRDDLLHSQERPGFHLLLEIPTAREVLRVWTAWRDGQAPTTEEAAGAVIHYAEHDAYQPVGNSE